ncbi:hypothetical protein [Streptomyces globisporus]|uniref:hypothetical protein n=1 Tax=Streptomyces globisporus TaxID=1908 RepID=UPI0037F86B9D
MDGTAVFPLQLSDHTRIAQEELTQALAGRPLIDFDRHTTGSRVAYAAPIPVSAARPALALGCYTPWHPATPAEAIAAEQGTAVRPGGPRKHTWWDEIAQQAVARIQRFHHPPVVAGWYAAPALHALAGTYGTIAALASVVRDQIEDKSALGRILRSAGVAQRMMIPARTYGTQLPGLTQIRSDLGTKRIVVQAARDSGGRGTVFVDHERDMERAAQLPGPWRVSAFVEGWSSNTTVLSIPDGRGGVRVYVDLPSHKAIAVSAIGIGAAKSAGNDWSLTWPESGVADVVEAATRIGEWAWRTHRLVGLWGIDTIWTSTGPMINEINARKQGTTEVSGVNQQLAGYPPLAVAHLTTMLGGRVTWLPAADEFNAHTITKAATEGAPGPYYMKMRARQAVVAPEDFPGSGIYHLHAGRLIFERPGAHPAEADSDAGLVLIANAPAPGTLCDSGTELGTFEGITTGTASPFARPGELSRHGQALVNAYEQLLIPTE